MIRETARAVSTTSSKKFACATMECLGTSEATIDGGGTGINPISEDTFIDASNTSSQSPRLEALAHGKAAAGSAVTLGGAAKGLFNDMLGLRSKT